MNVYNQEELDRIARIRDTNDKLEDFFKNKRQEWKELIEPLFQVLKTFLQVPKEFLYLKLVGSFQLHLI